MTVRVFLNLRMRAQPFASKRTLDVPEKHTTEDDKRAYFLPACLAAGSQRESFQIVREGVHHYEYNLCMRTNLGLEPAAYLS